MYFPLLCAVFDIRCCVVITLSILSPILTNTSHSLLVRARYGMYLVVQTVIYTLPQSLRWCMYYHVNGTVLWRHSTVLWKQAIKVFWIWILILPVRLSARWSTELLWQPPEEYICEIVEMLCVWNVLYCILLEIKLILLLQHWARLGDNGELSPAQKYICFWIMNETLIV